MPVYTVTKIVHKANGDKEFYNVDALQATCQSIDAEEVSGTVHTLTTNTGEIIYDIVNLECVLVEPSGTNNGWVQCFQGGVPVNNDYWVNTNLSNSSQVQSNTNSWIKLAVDYTLNSVNTEQKLFNTTPNGALTLPTGTYLFEAIIYVTTLSSTSGNFSFDPIGGGTAVGASFLYYTVGVDNNTPTNAATQTGSFSATQQTVASAVAAGAGTAAGMKISGTFRITTAGTIIPSITLVTANAGVVKAGTYFSVTRIAEHNVNSVGAWT